MIYNNGQCLKIAMDLDGTVYQHPDLFSAIACGLKKEGHSVGILTHRLEAAHKQHDLMRLQQLCVPIDWYIGRQASDPTGGTAVQKRWKARMMRSNGISYLFDDFNSGLISIWEVDKDYDQDDLSTT